MIRRRVLALLAAPDDRITDALDSALRREADAARARVGSDAHCRVAVRVPSSGQEPPTDYDLILERGLANGVLLGGFSAVLEVSVGAVDGDAPVQAALTDCLAGLGDRLGSLIERRRSTVVFGTDLVIIDGSGPFQLFYCMRRNAGTTHEAFSTFWAEQHTTIATRTPGLAGYRQLHADLDRSREAASSAGLTPTEIDGMALEWFKIMDDFVGAVGGPPDYTRAAKASEQKFNDLDGVSAIMASLRHSSRGVDDAAW